MGKERGLMYKLSSLLEDSFSEMLEKMKQEYGTVKPEDIEKEKKTFKPGITIVGREKDMGIHRLTIFFVNEQGRRYEETFTDTPSVINRFIAKIKNIDSFAGQMKAYNELKSKALGFESKRIGE